MRITATSTLLLAAAACLLSSSTGAEAAKISSARRLGRNGSTDDNANDGASRQPNANANANADIDNNDRRLSTGKGKGSCGGKAGKGGSGKGKGKGSTPDDTDDDCTPTPVTPTMAPSSRPSIDLDGVDDCVLDAILESGWAGGKSGGKSGGKNGSGKSGKGGSQARRGLAKAGSSANAEGGASRLQADTDEHHDRRLSSGKGSCGGKSGKNGGKAGKGGSGKGSMGKGKGSADDTDDDGIDDCEQERIDDLCDAYCHCECNEEVQNEIDGILSILGKGKAGGKSGKNGSGKNGSGKGKGSQIDGRRELVEVERRLCGGKSGCKSGGKLGKGKGSRRLSSGKGKGGYSGDGCNAIDIIEEANEIIQEKCKPCECSHAPSSEPSSQPSKVPTSPPVTTPAQVAPEAGVVIEARQTCVKSHESYGFDMYPDLAGWCTEVTANTKLNCRDGNFNLGWNDPGERGFDNLKIVCPGQETITFGEFCPTDQQVQIGCKLYFYADNSHTYEGFNICTPPGIAGLAPCRPSAGVMRSNESRSGGICMVSHPEYNDFEARNGEGQPYPKLYGWSIPVTYSGTANARNFDIRGRGTGQFLSLIRDGKIIQQWQGDMGPQGIETRVGDVWQFFADDSSSCGTDPATGVQKCRKGFEICID